MKLVVDAAVRFDAQVQRLMDGAAHAIMRRFNVRKSVVRYVVNITMVIVAIANTVVLRVPWLLVSALGWLWVTHLEGRLDDQAEQAGMASRADAFFSTNNIGAVLLKCLWWIFLAENAAQLSSLGVFHDLTMLATIYICKTPSTPPPAKQESPALAHAALEV